MMSYQFYLLLHLLGIGALFFVLGGLFLHAVNGGTKETNAMRKPSAIMHGVALFLILLSGFGMLARIGASTSELWVALKVAIWVAMGAAIMVPLRAQQLARPLWFAVPLVLMLAGWIAHTKPGQTVEIPSSDVVDEVVVDVDAAANDAADEAAADADAAANVADDAAEDVVDAVGEVADDAADAMGDAAEDAVDAVEKVTDDVADELDGNNE